MEAIKTTIGEFEKISLGRLDEIDWEAMKPFYTNMSKDIDTQRKRIGGDFAIAQAVTSRDMRDHIRINLPDCVFITLTLTKENQLKRVKARHGEEAGEDMFEMFNAMFKFYEGPGDGEKNTYNIDISEDMTPNDVMNKVLEILDKHYK